MNLEIPKTQWIGTKDGFYSYESYPPFLNLVTASFGSAVLNTTLFNLVPKIIPLIFSILTLLIGALYSLKLRNYYIIGLLSIVPLEWLFVHTLNNDIVVAFFASLVFLVALKEINTKNVIILALFTSFALLSNYNALVLALVTLFYIKNNSKNRKLVIMFIAIVALLAGPWYLRNLLLYGDPLYVPSLIHTEDYKPARGAGIFFENYFLGFFPSCIVGLHLNYITLFLTILIIFFTMRNLEDRFKHMLSLKIVDPIALFLPLLLISWILFGYTYSDLFSPRYLISGILPLSVVASSSIKSKYGFWIIYIGFMYFFFHNFINCL